jgi:hypothetical protein
MDKYNCVPELVKKKTDYNRFGHVLIDIIR